MEISAHGAGVSILFCFTEKNLPLYPWQFSAKVFQAKPVLSNPAISIDGIAFFVRKI
jgi:hypothetical protein